VKNEFLPGDNLFEYRDVATVSEHHRGVSVDKIIKSCRQIIEYRHLRAELEEGVDQVRAYKSSASGDEHLAAIPTTVHVDLHGVRLLNYGTQAAKFRSARGNLWDGQRGELDTRGAGGTPSHRLYSDAVAGVSEAEHLREWCELIERVLKEPLTICNDVPIQHGKTETTLHGLVWLLCRKSDLRIVYMTYDHERAQKWGRE